MLRQYFLPNKKINRFIFISIYINIKNLSWISLTYVHYSSPSISENFLAIFYYWFPVSLHSSLISYGREKVCYGFHFLKIGYVL